MGQGININRFILSRFSIVVVLTGIAAVTAHKTTLTLSESNEKIAHTYQVEADLRELEKSLLEAEAGKRGFLLTNETSYLAAYEQATSELDNIFADLRELLANYSEQLERLSVVESLSDVAVADLEETIALKKEGTQAEVVQKILSNRDKDTLGSIQAQLLEMIQVEEVQLNARIEAADSAKSLELWVNWLSFAGVMVASVLISMAVVRSLTKSLNESLETAVTVAGRVTEGDLTLSIEQVSNNEIGKLMSALKQMTERLSLLISGAQRSGVLVTRSATQIAESGRQLEGGMREQAAATTQTAATASQIAATAKELAVTMEEVTSVSQSTTAAATDSQSNLSQMETNIRQLMDATEEIATRLGAISEKANGINSVVTTITKVAEQTNLLSLNAAIEAEKAGEYGAGFAVVAREIRRLADQTAVATLEIESMVREMQSSVSTGVMEMDKFSTEVAQNVDSVSQISTQMSGIIQQVQALAPRFSVVNEGMDSQVQGAQQISEAMAQLNSTSMQTSSSFEDINSAITQLHQAAQALQKEMNQFKVKDSDQYLAQDDASDDLDNDGFHSGHSNDLYPAPPQFGLAS